MLTMSPNLHPPSLYSHSRLLLWYCTVSRAQKQQVKVTGNAITVCLGTAFLMSMGNFTAILQSQQVISNHNDTLMFTRGAEQPVVVLSFGHLILLII